MTNSNDSTLGASQAGSAPTISSSDVPALVATAKQLSAAASQLLAQTQIWNTLLAPVCNTAANTDSNSVTPQTASNPPASSTTPVSNNSAPAPASSKSTSAGTASALNLASLQGAIPDTVLQQIPATAAKYSITSNLRLAHFLSQCAQERANLTVTVENLNYSVSTILALWPSKFTQATAEQAANDHEFLANTAYANVNGNGDYASGDGYAFIGRGYIQLTGRSNYTAFKNDSGVDVLSKPSLVASTYPLDSAGFYFATRANLWSSCDEGASYEVVEAVTKLVNGGTTGLSQRWTYFQQFWGLLSA